MAKNKIILDNMKINQILPAISYGDAVSSDAIEIQKLLRDLGYSSEIYSKYIHPKCSQYAKSLNDYKGNANNILLYHFSMAGMDVTDFVKSMPDSKALIYHNITPPEYFLKYDVNLSYMCSRGRDELKTMCEYFQLGIGDSEFNRLELERIGFKRTEVLPIVVDFDKYAKYDRKLVNGLLKDKFINFLFVGRIAPNKCQEDIIKVFYYYNTIINKNSRLYLVGDKQIAGYVSELECLIRELDLSQKISLTGMVDNRTLAAYYKSSNIFLSMSEHEGFCVPLIEAMSFGIPVIAYASAGIPYTLEDAGILLHKKNYIEIAELINIIINNKMVLAKLLKRQYQRQQKLNKNLMRERLVNIISKILN